jgi:flagellar hook-associated protein 2
MAAGDTMTIGGLTLTATGTITQAQAVAAFASLTAGATAGNAVTNGTWSGTLTGFSSEAASGTSLKFTSTTLTTDVTNLAVSATQKASVTETVPSAYTISMSINGEKYDLDLTSGTTLAQLKDLINDETDGKVTASILNVGGTNPYKLVIKSVGTGEDNAITFSSTSETVLKNLGLDSTSLLTNGNHLQSATDANFTYNGVTISRSTNTISDLVSGLSITLNEAQETGTTTSVSVKQNLSNIKSSLESLVTKYNDLMSNLTSATKYDVDTQTAGTFQGVSQVTSLSANVNRQLLGTDELGRSILDYGITLNEAGILEFDASVFDAKISEDASDVEDFFRGSITYSATNYTGTSVLAGSLDFSFDNFMINGVSIAFSTETTNTKAQNALALQSAINSAGLSGIEAFIGDDNNVYLQSLSGNDIEITGDATKLASIGFFATNVYTQSTGREGFFSNFNTMLSSYITGDKSILTLFESTLISEKESLDKQRLSTMERLDKRYEIMATRFGAYDTIINKLNNQFKSLSMMIEQSYQ